MIPFILIMATVGILVGYYFQQQQQQQQLTESFVSTDADNNDVAILFPANAGEILGQGQDQAQSMFLGTPDGKPATPYMNIKGSDAATAEGDPNTGDDPRDLPWIASWSPADKMARGNQNCDVKYRQAGEYNTEIITTSKSCEAGMPHTRAGGRIILPDSIPDPFRKDIIQHEMIHVFQSRFPDAWAEFYRKSWAFEVFKSLPPFVESVFPLSVKEARRANPDTFTVPWCCWMGRYWPVPIYLNSKNPSLRDARTVWWDQWKNEVLTEPPSAWTEFFGSVSQDEHPHEIAAVLLTDTGSHGFGTEASRRLMNWWTLKSGTMTHG